jgi:hypothetical protein
MTSTSTSCTQTSYVGTKLRSNIDAGNFKAVNLKSAYLSTDLKETLLSFFHHPLASYLLSSPFSLAEVSASFSILFLGAHHHGSSCQDQE